jgi:hypothetical protein
MTHTTHANLRAKQRGIPPLVERWLDDFGEERYDGHGGIVRFFSRRSRRMIERTCGRAVVARLSEYLDCYKVEANDDGATITMGHCFRRINRR